MQQDRQKLYPSIGDRNVNFLLESERLCFLARHRYASSDSTTSRPARRKAVAGFCLPHPADRDWHANQVFKKPVGHGHAEGLCKKVAASPRGIWICRYLFCS